MGVTRLRDDQMQGEVQGPAGSTDTAIARFDSTTGKLLQNSAVTVSDTGSMAGVVDLDMTGDISGASHVFADNLIVAFNGTFGSTVDMGGNAILNVADPTSAQDAATKNYVDTNALTASNTATVTNKDLTSGTNTFPTFNQNTTGSAATLTTARTFRTNLASTSTASFDGSANVTPGVTGTLAVGNGGTGRATATTAYGLIAAGTTATAAQQTISPGTSGQFLKSAGGAALASFASIAESDVTNLTTDLAAKAPLASPTFTGTVSGITATMVGLGSVTNNAQLKIASNLSDLNNTTTARTNLGLGSIATLSAPSGTVVGTTDTQTITNKTISTGTVFSDNIVPAAALATSAITLGYSSMTNGFSTSSTSAVQVNGTVNGVATSNLSVAVTIPSGGRKVKITVWCGLVTNGTSGSFGITTIWDGTVGSGTQLASAWTQAANAGGGGSCNCTAIVTPSAGSKTYNVGFRANSGTANFNGDPTYPAFIHVEAI